MDITIVAYEWIGFGIASGLIYLALLVHTCCRSRLTFLIVLEILLVLNYAINIVTNLIKIWVIKRDPHNVKIIVAWFLLDFFGNSCYFCAHWLFSWRYWLVARLIANFGQKV